MSDYSVVGQISFLECIGMQSKDFECKYSLSRKCLSCMPWLLLSMWQKVCMLDGSGSWGVPAVCANWCGEKRPVLPEWACLFSGLSKAPYGRLKDKTQIWCLETEHQSLLDGVQFEIKILQLSKSLHKTSVMRHSVWVMWVSSPSVSPKRRQSLTCILKCASAWDTEQKTAAVYTALTLPNLQSQSALCNKRHYSR